MSSDPGSDADPRVVVTAHEEALLETVSAAVQRSGQGARVMVVCCPRTKDAVAALEAARERGARGVPVLGVADREDGAPSLTPAGLALLTDPRLRDLNVAVPSFSHDKTRRILWEQLRAARIEDRHQLIEVDGRSAALFVADVSVLAAAAAGILAGRMAAADRTWSRPQP